MLRSYRYQLRPTHKQEGVLLAWLSATRELYNAALQERRDAYRKQHVSISLYDQMKQIPEVRAYHDDCATVPVVVLRGALRRLDKAYKAFFRRVKSGEKPGFPRFKGAGHWDSILINDLRKKSQIVAGGKRLAVPLLGKVKLRMHRPLEGKPKALRITRDARGRWFATFACVDVPARPLAPTGKSVGIDLGLHHFIATSDGDVVPNERSGQRAARKLARAQRRVSRRKRESKRRKKAVRLLRRAHEHVANVRRERNIALARALVVNYDIIAVEDLNIRGLAKSMLARSVHDAAWGNFLHWLRVKAESAGREVVAVDPRGTSQECPECGNVVAKSLSQRVHRCECGLVCDRDVAAAQVILARGLRVRGGKPVDGPQRSAKPKSMKDLSNHASAF